jgi:hypothetical protein
LSSKAEKTGIPDDPPERRPLDCGESASASAAFRLAEIRQPRSPQSRSRLLMREVVFKKQIKKD